MTHNTTRPLIGVTGPDRGGTIAWWFTRLAIWRAGGRAVRVQPARPHTVDALDGLVIGGGADVDPSLYDLERELDELDPFERLDPETRAEAQRDPEGMLLSMLLFLARGAAAMPRGERPAHGLDPARDAMELAMLARGHDLGLPVLGICRGAQLINTWSGGTLHRNISDHYADHYEERVHLWTALPRRKVFVEEDTLLGQWLGPGDCMVNALHNHAVGEPGALIRTAAREPSGVIQAIERTDRPMLVGVQWHPEYLPQHRRQGRLFRALVEHAIDRARERAHPLFHVQHAG